MFKKLIQTLRRYTTSPERWARQQGVKIGKGCQIAARQWSSEPYLIEIGDYVRIASGTSFYTHGGVIPLRHLYNDPTLDHFGKIKIGNYTSIGANCMIMPGVTIGNQCIVGGGTVVTKSVPDGCMVAGNPARFIGRTEDFYHRLKEKGLDTRTGGLPAEEKKRRLLALPDSAFESKPLIKTER